MQAEQRIRHDHHRDFETESETSRRSKHTMSLEDGCSIHEEGKAGFNKARSVHRRRCGMTRKVIGRLDSVQKILNPPPSRPLPPDPPSSSSARIDRAANILPPLRPVSPLAFVDYDDNASARPAPGWRKLGHEALNMRANEDAMRGLSYSETATTPPTPTPHRLNVEKRGGVSRPSEDAPRGSSHSETLAVLRHPNHAQQEPHVSYASEDTMRRRQRIRLVTKEDEA